MDQWLMEDKRIPKLSRKWQFDQTPPAQVFECARRSPGQVAPRERVANFEEVTVGLTAVEALDEANRCLRCDIKVTD
jgi:hypothetical protein